MDKIKILNVYLDNISKQEILECYDSGLFVTPNVDVIMKSHNNRDFYNAVKKASMVICDSKIIGLCSKLFLFRSKVKEVVPGSSLFIEFCRYHKDHPQYRIFFLGAKEGVGEIARKNVNKKIGIEIVCASYSPPWGFEKDENETRKIIDLVDASNATVIVTGISDPKQTIWLANNMNRFKTAKMFMALGATIDFEAGNIKRAPIIFQKLALEWLYRMINDPKRLIKRYMIDDIKFFFYIFIQRLGLYRNPFE